MRIRMPDHLLRRSPFHCHHGHRPAMSEFSLSRQRMIKGVTVFPGIRFEPRLLLGGSDHALPSGELVWRGAGCRGRLFDDAEVDAVIEQPKGGFWKL